MKILRGTGLVIGALIVAIALVIVAIALLNMGITSIEQTRQVETGELKPLLPQLVNIPVTLNALDLENDISILVQNRYSKPVEVVRVWLLDENDKPIKIIDASKLFQNQIIQPGNLCFNIIEKPSDNVKYVYVELAKIGIKKTLIQPPDIPPTPQPAPPPPPETPVYTSLIGIAKQVTFNNLNKITVQSYEDNETLKESVEDLIDKILPDVTDEVKGWLADIITYSLWSTIFDDKVYEINELNINLNQSLTQIIEELINYIEQKSSSITDINNTALTVPCSEPILMLKTKSPINVILPPDNLPPPFDILLDLLESTLGRITINTTLNIHQAIAILKNDNVYEVIRMFEEADIEDLKLNITSPAFTTSVESDYPIKLMGTLEFDTEDASGTIYLSNGDFITISGSHHIKIILPDEGVDGEQYDYYIKVREEWWFWYYIEIENLPVKAIYIDEELVRENTVITSTHNIKIDENSIEQSSLTAIINGDGDKEVHLYIGLLPLIEGDFKGKIVIKDFKPEIEEAIEPYKIDECKPSVVSIDYDNIESIELKDCDNWRFLPNNVDNIYIIGFIGLFREDKDLEYRLATANFIKLSKADTELLDVPLLAYVKVSEDNHLIALKECKNKLSYQLVYSGSELARMYILSESDIITKVEVKAKRILVSGASRPLTEATITNVKDVFGRKTLLIITTQDNKVYLIENLETLTIYVDGEYKVIEVKEAQGQVKLPGILQDIAELLGLQGIIIDSHTDTAPIQIDANNIEKLKIRVENGEGGTITYTTAQT